MAEKVAALAANTPLENHAGVFSIDDVGSVPLETMSSYLEVHQVMNERHKSKEKTAVVEIFIYPISTNKEKSFISSSVH